MAKYNKHLKNGIEYYRSTFTLNGKKYDLSALTELDLDNKIFQARRDFEEGQDIQSPNVIVSAWAKKWLEVYKKNDVVDKSYKLYETNLNTYILPKIGSVKMREVKKYQLQQILNTESGKSKSHINHVKCAITGMFASALENGIISNNPSKGLKIPITATSGTHRPITSLERLYLFLICGYHYMGLWPLLMYYCGLRPGECCGLCGPILILIRNL
jgi:integrase